jgi:putative addiction module component (TIGR02574 family)
MNTLQEIENAILKLSDQDRLYLANKILNSLPPPPESQEPDEFLKEAIRRDQELENGVAKPLTEEEFWDGITRTH